MANTKSFIEHVVDLFAAIEPVATRPMFGGTSLLVDGLMIGFVDDDELFLKVDAESEPQFTALRCKQFTYPMKDGPMPMAYYQPPPGALEDPRELRPWFHLAMGAAVRKNAVKEAKANEKRLRMEARAAKAAGKGSAPAARARPVPKSVTKPPPKPARKKPAPSGKTKPSAKANRAFAAKKKPARQ